MINNKKPWAKHYSEEALSYNPDKMRYQSLSDLFFDVGERFAKSTAFTAVLPNGVSVSITYEEYNTYSNYFAAYLREVIGLKKGDVIALQTPNCLGYPVAATGIIKAGCVLTSLNPLYTPSEMKYQLNDCNVKTLVIIDLFGYKVDEIIDDTKVENVILLSLFDFMPTLKRIFFSTVFKYIKKGIPKVNTPTVNFLETLKIGEQKIQSKGINATFYSSKIKADDHAVYQYTGGTTGRSKGAILTHKNLLSNIEQIRIMLGSSINEDEKGNMLSILPLYHIFAFTLNMLVNITYGWGNILVPNPRPLENLKPVFKNHKITWMTGVNTLFVALLNADWFKYKIGLAAAGGAALQVSVATEWAEKHGVIVEGYGLSETSPALSFNPPAGPIRVGTVGIPMPGVDLKFVDDNDNEVPYGEVAELCARGPNVTKGYLKESEEIGIAIKDGWFHTGDIAVLDDEGFVKIIDRKKDLILVSGFSVYPNELESVISGFDGILDVAVAGVKDRKSGEVPKAYIVLSDKGLTEEKIIKMCQKEMISYKVPKYIKFVDDLPKTPVGKVLRRHLNQLD